MNKEKLRDLIYVLVAILLSAVAIKLVIWLLPIIIIAILAYFIYKSMKKTHTSNDNQTWERHSDERPKKKNKKIIIDEEK